MIYHKGIGCHNLSDSASFLRCVYGHNIFSHPASRIKQLSLWPRINRSILHHDPKMSFGFSPSDFIAVGTIVVELRRAYRSAPEEYRSLATNLDLFNGILEQIKRDEDDPTSALGQCTMPQRRKVGNILRGLEEILTHLERIRRRYQSGEGMSRVWNRLTFPTTDVRFLQAQLQLNISALKLFLDSLTRETLREIVQVMEESQDRAGKLIRIGRRSWRDWEIGILSIF